MKETPLISIIVPIYGNENDLPLCIESLMSQTYRNIEIILVEDGSPDNCGTICDAYAENDSRIIVVHKQNGGLVSARKAGIEIAKGKFIGYVDGDDSVEPGFYETLLLAQQKNDADIVCAGYSRDIEDVTDQISNVFSDGYYDRAKMESIIFPRMICAGEYFYFGIYSYVWNKLFRKTVLYDNQMRVDNCISVGEDVACTFPSILQANSIEIISDFSYHYRQRNGSILKTMDSYEKENTRLEVMSSFLKKIFADLPCSHVMMPQIQRYIDGIYLIRSNKMPEGESDFKLFDKILPKDKVAIYSAGTFGQNLFNRLHQYYNCEIVDFYDKDYVQYRVQGLEVKSDKQVNDAFFDKIVIASLDYRYISDVVEKLLENKVPISKIVHV